MSKQPVNPSIDQDNPEWTEEMVQQSVRISGLPASLQSKLATRKRGPNKAPTKERISIRLSPEVVQYFRNSGDGWQSRMDSALKDWVASQQS